MINRMGGDIMKKNGSALAYVLILLSALLIVCTGVSSYVIGTTKLNKSYSTIIDSKSQEKYCLSFLYNKYPRLPD